MCRRHAARSSATGPLSGSTAIAGHLERFHCRTQPELGNRSVRSPAQRGRREGAGAGSAADLAAVDLSLQAELATDYFSLRGDDTTIQLLEDTIKVYDRAYELTKNRYDEGISAATDVDQADTLRQNARAQLAAVRLERAQLEHAIAVSVGRVPSRVRARAGAVGGRGPPIDSGLPSELLERRPDVARAERAMAAANAQIGVARAAWFPVFTLPGAGGFESIIGSQWFKAPSRFWSVGPCATVPLLDVGARSALNKQARAAYDEAVANYRKTTLTAYQEVEDNLAALHHLADELTADEAAATSAQRALPIMPTSDMTRASPTTLKSPPLTRRRCRQSAMRSPRGSRS